MPKSLHKVSWYKDADNVGKAAVLGVTLNSFDLFCSETKQKKTRTKIKKNTFITRNSLQSP